MSKKNFSDHFEDLYLRHDYLRKAGKLDGDHYHEFKHIINITTKHVYAKYQPIFFKVGFEFEDVENITAMYALSYMQLYSLRGNKNYYKRFLKRYQQEHGDDATPSEEEVFKNECNLMINFLRQKLSHCATVCERKKRNIVCGRQKRGVYAYTEKSTPASYEEIFEDHKKHGYRKVTQDELKIAAEAADENKVTYPVDKDGYKIFIIELPTYGIERYDYTALVEGHISGSLRNPEEIALNIESMIDLETYRKKMADMTPAARKKVLKKFIERAKGTPSLKDQVKLARKMLKNPDFMVTLIERRDEF